MTRQEKLACFGELAKLPGIKRASVYADKANQARLLINHPGDGVTWNIDGPADVPGFYHLSVKILLWYSNYPEPSEYTTFDLLLADSEFERIQ